MKPFTMHLTNDNGDLRSVQFAAAPTDQQIEAQCDYFRRRHSLPVMWRVFETDSGLLVRCGQDADY